MAETERLDKVVASRTALSRREVRRLASHGQVTVNGLPERSCERRVDPDADEIAVAGRALEMGRHAYLMLNKPRGVVCATHDDKLPTVLDLVPEELRRSGLFPAGRLDKDTEGFVLITDDGEFAHRILAPRSHVPKTYTARLDRPAGPELVEAFAAGVVLDGRTCMPALLAPDPDDPRTARVVLRQGMYHQVKRMFGAYGITVTALRRDAIGGLALDPDLEPGKCRKLSKIEVERILTEGL